MTPTPGIRARTVPTRLSNRTGRQLPESVREAILILGSLLVLAVVTRVAPILRPALVPVLGVVVIGLAWRSFHLGVAWYLLVLPFLDLFPDQFIGVPGMNAKNLMIGGLVFALVGKGFRWDPARTAAGRSVVVPLIALYTAAMVGVGISVWRHQIPFDYANGQWWTIVSVTLPLFLGLIVARQGERERRFLALILLAGVTLVCLWALSGHAVKVAAGADPSRLRTAGIMGQANNFGAFIALGVPGLVAVAGEAKRTAIRVAAFVACGVCVMALMNTLSRGSFLSCAAGLLLVGALRYRKLLLLLAAGGLLFGSLLVPSYVTERINATVDELSGEQVEIEPRRKAAPKNIDLRAAMYRVAPDVFRVSPVFGNGLGAFPLIARRFGGWQLARSPHSWYIQVVCELGIMGVVVSSWLTLAVFVTLWRYRRGSTFEAAASTALLGSTLALTVACFFQKPFVDSELILPYYFAALGVVVGVASALADPGAHGRSGRRLAPYRRAR